MPYVADVNLMTLIQDGQPEYREKKMLISHERLFKAIEQYFTTSEIMR